MATFTLANGTTPAVQIVKPVAATTNETTAADELKAYLDQIIGGTFTIITDDDVVEPTNLISVGNTDLVTVAMQTTAKVGQTLKLLDVANNGFLIQLESSVLYLLGQNDLATIYAVYHFLEQLGCRWFFGLGAASNGIGDVGMHVPTSTLLTWTEQVREYYTPDIGFNSQYEWNGTTEVYHVQNGVTMAWAANTEGNYWQIAELESYWRTHKTIIHASAGAVVPGDSGHNFETIWPTSNATYYPHGNTKQPCFTTQAVIDRGISWAKTTLTANPTYRMITFAPRDGNAYCTCAECLAAFPDGLGGVNAADVTVYLGQQMRRGIEDDYPDVMVQVWGYDDSARAPNPDVQFDGYSTDDDMIIVKLTFTYAQLQPNALIDAWALVTNNIVVSPWFDQLSNLYGAGHETNPWSYVDQIEHNIARWRTKNVRGTHVLTEHCWPRVGFSKYYLQKKLWDISVKLHDVQWDFASKMFPTCPIPFYNYLSLQMEFFSEPDYLWKDGTNLVEGLKQSFEIFEYIRTQSLTAIELKRWRWWAIYLHVQRLELDLATTMGEAYTDADRLAAVKPLIRYLKGANDFRHFNALNIFQHMYYPLICTNTTPPNDWAWHQYWYYTDGSNPPEPLRKYLPGTPDVNTTYYNSDFQADTIVLADMSTTFAADKTWADGLSHQATIQIMNSSKTAALIADGWTNCPSGNFLRTPTDFTSSTLRTEANLSWITEFEDINALQDGSALLLAPFRAYAGAGGVITFVGSAPGQAVYWELVSVDPESGLEGAALGSLRYEVTVTDQASRSANIYLAPAALPGDGSFDRVKVTYV